MKIFKVQVQTMADPMGYKEGQTVDIFVLAKYKKDAVDYGRQEFKGQDTIVTAKELLNFKELPFGVHRGQICEFDRINW